VEEDKQGEEERVMVKKKTSKEAEGLLEESELTEKNKIFCREYIFDWNGTRSYKAAYGDMTDEVAKAAASRLLTKVNVTDYLELIQKDLEKIAGISRLRQINEHLKIAYSTIAHLHNTWIDLKTFEDLTEDQKACIEEISTKKQHKTEWEYEGEERIPVDYTVEYVKIKLYDKQKSLDAINKMLGYDAPIKSIVDVNVAQLPDIIIK
jgi:phage terminase small subunit